MLHQVKKTIDSPTVTLILNSSLLLNLKSEEIVHNNLSANSKRKIISVQGKSAAHAVPLQVLQVQPYRVLCKKIPKIIFLLNRFVFLLILIRILFDVIIPIILSDFLQTLSSLPSMSFSWTSSWQSLSSPRTLLPSTIFLAISVVTRSIFFLL